MRLVCCDRLTFFSAGLRDSHTGWICLADLLEMKLDDATVVAVYLLPEAVGLKLETGMQSLEGEGPLEITFTYNVTWTASTLRYSHRCARQRRPP